MGGVEMARRVKRKNDEDKPDADARAETPTHVYVFASEGRTKIGIAGDPQKRATQIRNASGVAVKIVASRLFSTRLSAIEVEGRLHRRFHAGRLHGEWFTSDPDKVAAVLADIADPELHSPSWVPGMPVEVATGDIYARWKWTRANGMKTLNSFVDIYGRITGPKMFKAQVPRPAVHGE